MTIYKAIILGAVQGLAEFLPISSSGHLLVFRNLLALGDVPILFDVLLHVATLLVVLVVFRNKIISLLKSLWLYMTGKRDKDVLMDMMYILIILLITFITGILGIFINQFSDRFSPLLVSILFLFTAIILWFARGKGSDENPGWKQGIILGIAQGFGVLPGISRSGITLSAARISGISREKAGELSFLMSVPAIMGALILDLKDSDALFSSISTGSLVISFITAFTVGYFSLTSLLKLLKSEKLHYFSYYLFLAGIVGIIFFS